MTTNDPDSVSPAERRERTALYRHKLLFVGGFAPMFIGGMAMSLSRWLGLALVAASGACYVASGLYAMAARRHMFAFRSVNSFGTMWVRASDRDRVGASIAGGLLIVLGLAIIAATAKLAWRLEGG